MNIRCVYKNLLAGAVARTALTAGGAEEEVCVKLSFSKSWDKFEYEMRFGSIFGRVSTIIMLLLFITLHLSSVSAGGGDECDGDRDHDSNESSGDSQGKRHLASSSSAVYGLKPSVRT